MTFEEMLIALGMCVAIGFLAQFINIIEVVVSVPND